MNILVIIGHPIQDSFNHALARAYADAARTHGAEVQVIDLATDATPDHPRERSDVRLPRSDREIDLDEHVRDYAERLRTADHIALFYPMWWGTYPAVLKQFFDRVLLSGDAYASRVHSSSWIRGLRGRTARIVHTADSPRLFTWLAYRDSSISSVKTATLWYTGIRTIGVRYLAPVRSSSPERRRRWLTRIARDGVADAKRRPEPGKSMAHARDLLST